MIEKIIEETAAKILNSDEVRKPLLTEMGSTFAYAWQGTFSSIETWAKKKQIKQAYELEKYKLEIEDKFNSIPTEKLTEAKLETIGPALEASKYYIENDELRNMFSNLIASSFNLDKTDIAHPAFVEIIKQLSPLDAKIFKELYLNKNTYGVAEIRLNIINNEYIPLYKTFFPLSYLTSDNLALVQSSIDNLLRLGLIQINPNLKSSDDSVYKTIENHEIYKVFNSENITNSEFKVSLHKMLWHITFWGINFANACIF